MLGGYTTSVIDLGVAPSAGVIFGSAVNKSIIDSINNTHNSGRSVIFGQAEDPFRTQYQHFMSAVVNPVLESIKMLERTRNILNSPAMPIVPITSEQMIPRTPPQMYGAILAYPPIYAQLEQGNINGWGYKPANVDKEDPIGRLINNGEVHFDTEEDTTWSWHSDDPDLTDDELTSIDETRKYFDSFIQQQIEQKTYFDPTAYPSGRIKHE